MSGRVVGRRQRQPVGGRHRRTAGCCIIRGDASARCGISLKGADIVVRGLDRPHERVHGADRRARRAAATPATRSATRSTRRTCTCAARSPGLGADCIEKELRDEHRAELAGLLDAAGVDGRRRRRLPALRLGAASSTPSRSTTSGTDGRHRLRTPALRESATCSTATRSPRSSARRARASTTSAASAPSAGCRTSTTCCSSARACRATRSRATASAATPTSCSATRHREEAAAPEDPDHDRRHELRRAVGAGQGGARPRRERGRHVDHDRRRRHDAGGARALRAARLPAAALALRHEPRRPAPRRRDRGRGRPGRQARRRRDAARPQDLRPRRRDARPAEGHRPALAPAGTPTGPGPDDLEIKIQELREITDWQKPIYVKVGATRTYYDVQLAVKAGADVVVLDGMQGGTAATQDVFIEHVGIPTLPAIPQAVRRCRSSACTARCS